MTAPRPSAVLFDWDNTLIDTFPVMLGAHNAVRRVMDQPLWTEADGRANIRLAAKDAFPLWYGNRAAQAEEIYTNHVRANHLQQMAVVDGAQDLIHYLGEQGILAGIVSNKRGEFLRKEIAHAGWNHYFAVVVGADDVKGPGKPAPDGVLQALKALNMGPETAWYVGDTENDILTARAAGTIPVFIENLTMNTPEEITALNPAMTFKNPRECLAYIKGLV